MRAVLGAAKHAYWCLRCRELLHHVLTCLSESLTCHSREDQASLGLSLTDQQTTGTFRLFHYDSRAVCAWFHLSMNSITEKQTVCVNLCLHLIFQAPRDPSHMECIIFSHSSVVNKWQKLQTVLLSLSFLPGTAQSREKKILRRCLTGLIGSSHS